jgi:hypothetical protein
MLTEDMLGALLDALQGVKRLILVGDPAQLPPIGAGRPFVDIIAKLRPTDYETLFPRRDKGYAELTVERRQLGADRPDLRLARWFSSAPPSAGEDELFFAGDHANIRCVEWQKPEDFQKKLIEVLVQELKLSSPDDIRDFNRALSATLLEFRGTIAGADGAQIGKERTGLGATLEDGGDFIAKADQSGLDSGAGPQLLPAVGDGAGIPVDVLGGQAGRVGLRGAGVPEQLVEIVALGIQLSRGR